MMMIQLSFWQTKLGVFTLSKDTDDGKKGREKESATRLNTNTNRFKIKIQIDLKKQIQIQNIK